MDGVEPMWRASQGRADAESARGCSSPSSLFAPAAAPIAALEPRAERPVYSAGEQRLRSTACTS